MPKFITDQEMQALEAQHASNSGFISDADMSKLEQSSQAEQKVAQPLFPGESTLAGALTGVLGEKVSSEATYGRTEQLAPKEPELAERVYNHPDYYAGYVMGRAAQFASVAKLASALGVTGAGTSALEATGLSAPVSHLASESAITSAVSEYSDTENLSKSAIAGVVGGVLGGALGKVVPSLAPIKEMKGSSIADSVRADSLEMGEFANYSDAINSGAVSGTTPAAKWLNTAIDQLPLSGVFKKFIKFEAGETKDQAIIAVQDAAAAQSKEALAGWSKGLMNSSENIAERKVIDAHKAAASMLSASEDTVQQAQAEHMAETLSGRLDKFGSKVERFEQGVRPVLDAVNRVSDYAARKTGGVVNVGQYVTETLSMWRDQYLKGITSELQELPNYSSIVGGSYRGTTPLQTAIKYHEMAMDVMKLHEKAWDKYTATPLVEKLTSLAETLKSGKKPVDGKILQELVSSAEQMRYDTGFQKTYAENVLNFIKELNKAPKTPQAAEKLAAWKLTTLEMYKEGKYQDILDFASDKMGIKDIIANTLTKPIQSAARPGVPVIATNVASNLGSIFQYNANRDVSKAGAKETAKSIEKTPAERLTEPLGRR